MKIILPLFLLYCFTAHSQSDNAKTAIYLEILGNGGVYSINIERKLSSNIYGRIGVSVWSIEGDSWIYGNDWEKDSYIAFPVMVNKLFGTDNNYLEVGAGVLLGWHKSKSRSAFTEEESNKNRVILDLTGVVGYRYQNPKGGFLVRIGLTPFLALTGGEDAYPDQGFFLSGGLSLGYSF